jgi:uncharacterized protein YcbX
MSEETGLGTVAALRRYPVKSMLGEDLPAGDVTLAGLAGDRVLWCALSRPRLPIEVWGRG